MSTSQKLNFAAAILGIAALGPIATAALASPGSGVTSSTLVTANLDHEAQENSDRVKFQTKDATDVRVQSLTFAAGAYSGWHHHPGIIIVAVQSGSVTLTETDCSTSTTYGPGLPAGSVFVEGGDNAQQATSAGGAVVYVTYVAPSADPQVFRIEDPEPFCDASF